jgi:surface antigen
VLYETLSRRKLRITTALMICLFVPSCITPSGQTATNEWQIDSVAARCLASVAGGAVVGALIGAAAGGGSRTGSGALLGAAAGGVLCAVMVTLDEQDRARIRAAQLEAARTGQDQTLQYPGKDGLERKVIVKVTKTDGALPPPAPRTSRTKPSAAPKTSPATPVSAPTNAQIAAATGQKVCRTLATSVDVQTKGQADVPPQVVCRTSDGDWLPEGTATASVSADKAS